MRRAVSPCLQGGGWRPYVPSHAENRMANRGAAVDLLPAGPLRADVFGIRKYGWSECGGAQRGDRHGTDRGLLLRAPVFRRKDPLLGVFAQAQAAMEPGETGDHARGSEACAGPDVGKRPSGTALRV